MAKTTRQTTQDLEALNRELEELYRNSQKAASEMAKLENDPSGLDSLKALQTQYESLQARMREVLTLQKEIMSGQKLSQVGTVSSGSSSVKNASSSPPLIDEDALRRESGGLKDTSDAADKAAKSIKGLTEEQRKLIQETNKYAKALEYATKVDENFTASTLKRVSQGGLGGRSSLDFEYVDKATGSVRQLQLAVDEAGNVFPSVQRKFRGFAESVVRDVGELTKWTLAIGLIYGPLQKTQEILTLMVENESKLADAGVAINEVYGTTGQIFDTVATSADKAGEAINETIDAFAYSFRAVGSSVGETERYTAATNLMNDALILSKLSSLNASQSIDTLSAAIRQSGGDFSQAEHLIDSWVKVTKIANVDMTTLATGVATLGDAAETAGIDTDHLNGIIATLAESSNMSGQEVANAARALVSGLQSEQAQKALQDVGIATKDANLQLRDFLDIIKDIRERAASGLIDPTQFADLTLKLGGGSRRQATFSSFITNSGNIDNIAAQSASATGEAQDALARKTATAETAMVRLDNSFQELAQTLGNEGGFLQIFKDMTNVTADFVEGLDSVTSLAGKATPALLALGAASAYLLTRSDPAATKALLTRRIQGGITGGLDSMFGTGVENYGTRGGQIGPQERSYGGRIGDFLTGSGVGSRATQGLMAGAIPAIYNATSGEKFGTEKAAADLVGGFVGGLVGGPAGAIIGTAIAEGFVRAVTTDSKLGDFFGGIAVTGGGSTPKTEEDAIAELLKNQVILGSTSQTEFMGNAIATIRSAVSEGIVNQANDVFAKGKIENPMDATAIEKLKLIGVTQDVIDFSLQNKAQIDTSKLFEQTALLGATKEAQDAFNAYRKQQTDSGKVEGQDSLFQQKLNKTGLEAIGGATTNAYLDSIVKERLAELDNQRVEGKIKPTEYQTQSSSVSGARSVEEGYFTGFGKEFMDAAKIDSAAEAYRGLLDVLTYGGEDSKNTLNQLLASITEIINMGDEAEPEDIARLAQYKKQAGIAAADALTEAKLSRIETPQIIGNINAPRTSKEADLVEQRTKELQRQFYSSKEGGQLSESEMNAYLKKNFEEAAEPIKDATTLFYKMLEAFDPRFRAAAEDQLMEEGKISGGSKDKGIGFQEFRDVDRSTLESLAARSVQINQQWSKPKDEGGFGYGGQVEDTIAIAKDGVAKPIHADMKILAMLLEKLVDQGQKQLDGMYNIPEGATFWVPLTAAYYRRGGGGGISGTEDLTTASMNDIDDGTTSIPKTIKNPTPDRNIGSTTYDMETGQSNAQNWLMAQNSRFENQLETMKRIAGPQLATGQTNAADWLAKWGDDGGSSFGGKKGLYSPANDLGNPQTMSTKLNINIQANTSVILDGRVIADIIKTYLTTDLINVASGTGSSTKDYLL